MSYMVKGLHNIITIPFFVGISALVLSPANTPQLLCKTDLRNAAEQDQPIYGERDSDSIQLCPEPQGTVPPHQTL